MSCGGVHTPHTSLRSLINKNLVTVDRDGAVFGVHDLLVDLGMKIGKKAKRHFVNGSIAEATITKKQVSYQMFYY